VESAPAPVSVVTISMSLWSSSSLIAHLLRRIVLDNQQAFAAGLGVFLD